MHGSTLRATRRNHIATRRRKAPAFSEDSTAANLPAAQASRDYDFTPQATIPQPIGTRRTVHISQITTASTSPSTSRARRGFAPPSASAHDSLIQRGSTFPVKTRKKKSARPSRQSGRPLSAEFALIYIVADERDLIRVRTSYRHKEIYLFRLTATPPAQARKHFHKYPAEHSTRIKDHPRIRIMLSPLTARPPFRNQHPLHGTNAIRLAHTYSMGKSHDKLHVRGPRHDRHRRPALRRALSTMCHLFSRASCKRRTRFLHTYPPEPDPAFRRPEHCSPSHGCSDFFLSCFRCSAHQCFMTKIDPDHCHST